MDARENVLDLDEVKAAIETPEDGRTPEVIAAEINVIKAETGAIIKRSIFEIGRRLCEAKAIVGHGNWAAWLADNVDYSETTAQAMMKAWREMGDEQINLLTGEAPADYFERLNLSQMVALFPIPADERRAFAEEINAEDKSVREIERLVREKREQERLLEEARAENEALKTSFEGQIGAAREAAARAAAEEARNALAARLDAAAGENSQLSEKVAKKDEKIKGLKKDLEGADKQIKEAMEENRQLHLDLEAAVKPDLTEEERAGIVADLEAKYALKADPEVQGITFNIGDISERVQKIEAALGSVAGRDAAMAAELREKVQAAMTQIFENVGWKLA